MSFYATVNATQPDTLRILTSQCNKQERYILDLFIRQDPESNGIRPGYTSSELTEMVFYKKYQGRILDTYHRVKGGEMGLREYVKNSIELACHRTVAHSVKRAITDLMDGGFLIKIDKMKIAPSGKPNHIYQLNPDIL